MTRGVLLITAVPLAACATVPPTVPTGSGEPEERVQGEGSCSAEPAQALLGQTATAELGAEALRLTGARTLRWGPPDSAMTLDYRQDRVNVFYDRSMRVERVTCG